MRFGKSILLALSHIPNEEVHDLTHQAMATPGINLFSLFQILISALMNPDVQKVIAQLIALITGAGGVVVATPK